MQDTRFIHVRDDNVPGIVKEPLHIRIPDAILRPWQQDDAPSLARHANNPRVAACMRDLFPSPYTIGDALRFIAMADDTSCCLLLAIEVQGEAAGSIGIHPLKDVYRGTAEIGYWLAEPYWGRSIITDAIQAVIPVAFGQPGLIRLQAGVFANNPASMRVLEKCGFAREAVHRNAITKHGVVMDEVLYVYLKEKGKLTSGTGCQRSR